LERFAGVASIVIGWLIVVHDTLGGLLEAFQGECWTRSKDGRVMHQLVEKRDREYHGKSL